MFVEFRSSCFFYFFTLSVGMLNILKNLGTNNEGTVRNARAQNEIERQLISLEMWLVDFACASALFTIFSSSLFQSFPELSVGRSTDLFQKRWTGIRPKFLRPVLTNCLHIHGQMPIISLFVTGVQVEVNYQEM
jgi:hypothetical protein